MSDIPTVVTSGFLRDWQLPEPDSDQGKTGRGSVVVIGGAPHTPGAVLLTGLATLRVGAGKLTYATVEQNASALAVAVPEAGVMALDATDDGALAVASLDIIGPLVEDADGVVLGPGMAGPEQTREFVVGLLPLLGAHTTLVLDALGLTCGALDAAAVGRLGGRVVITPNPTEAGILLDDDTDREASGASEETTRRLAERFGAVVALRSTVASPDGRMWQDGSGNPGLGTSGSGDVLAGAIGGLAARGTPPDQAAVWGVHLHAEAGERLAARVGAVGYLARELLDELPQVLDQLSR
jgi:ADP-dependent NAD(P)H-hydrate dehydratase